MRWRLWQRTARRPARGRFVVCGVENDRAVEAFAVAFGAGIAAQLSPVYAIAAGVMALLTVTAASGVLILWKSPL